MLCCHFSTTLLSLLAPASFPFAQKGSSFVFSLVFSITLTLPMMKKPSLLLSFTAIVPPLFLMYLSSFWSSSLLAAVPVLAVSAIFVAVVVQKEKRKNVMDDGSPASSQKILLSEHFAENKVSQETAAVESKCEMVCDFDFTSSGSASRSGAGSDCSLTDNEDDGLIEIAFQEGAPIPLINEEKCQRSGEISGCPDIFSDDGVLTDDEMDEEDNLIELDISMGSIKLPMIGPEIQQQEAL